jgi:hypothetical protein
MHRTGNILNPRGASTRTALALSLLWIPLSAAFCLPAQAGTQEAAQAVEGLGGPVVPQQVRYAGKLATRAGDTVEAVFRIYASPEGGEPLWTETQRVTVAEDGSYSVLLGAASSTGLPQTVFAGGAARWIGVSIERSAESDRALLASVPYAMKSADAEALAGHAASDFVTQAQLAQAQLAQAQLAAMAAPATQTPAFTPLTSGSLTGSGTAGTVPLWTGALTQANSEITQVGSDIGVNEAAPTATLDVGGTANVRGTLSLPPVGAATTTTGLQSQLLELSSSAWSTVSNTAVPQTFEFLAEPTGNNTATPSGALYLAYQNGTATPTNLLSIASSGQINFAPGQLFPGTITGALGSGPIITGVTGHNITVGLSPAVLETTLNNVYAQTGVSNTFHGNQTVLGGMDVTALLTGEDSILSGTQTAQGFIATGAYVAQPSNAATSSTGVKSPFVELTANSYSSSSSASVPLTFAWQAQPAGNNTSTPSANLDLLYETGTPGLGPTGLSISPKGVITFSPSQTFPVAAGGGTITGVTTSSPLTGSGTTGSVALGLNENQLATDIAPTLQGAFDSVFAQLGTANDFAGEIIANQKTGTGYAALLGYGTNGSYGVYGQSDSGASIYGFSSTGSGILGHSKFPALSEAGVFGLAGAANSTSFAIWGEDFNAGIWADTTSTGISSYTAGLVATADNGFGVFAANNSTVDAAVEVINAGGPGVVSYDQTPASQQSGVLGVTGSSGSLEASGLNVSAGVWGDASVDKSNTLWTAGVIGTADDSYGGLFFNKSASWPTLFAENDGTNGHTGLFKTFMAVSKEGTCGIGGSGDLTCTGQMKSLVSTGGGARKVETYATQSAENWMEDYGSGTMQKGVSIVKLDPAFAETVSETADYHVFITPNGDSKGLYVINKTGASFEVRESGGGTSSLTFDYKIVAKRRGYENQRLVDVTDRYNAESAAVRLVAPADGRRNTSLRLLPKRNPTTAAPHAPAAIRTSAQKPAGQPAHQN